MEIESNRLPDGRCSQLAESLYEHRAPARLSFASKTSFARECRGFDGRGFVGLADALNKYDRSGPDRFEAYADCRIKGPCSTSYALRSAIRDFARSQ